jgi:hypothetical protein
MPWALLQVRTMQEHWAVMRSLLAPDVAYQAPIIAAYDRWGGAHGALSSWQQQ